MAYAAYRESLGVSLVSVDAAAPAGAGIHWQVLDITVASRDALLVRRALLNCPQTGVLRCIPRLKEQLVRLEIRLPGHQIEEVMRRLMACVACGEVGRLISWRCHLQRHGLHHGL